MKKLSYILLFLLVSFSGLVGVKAEDPTTPHHIYHINDFNISTSSQKITFEGFAFIDHRDNYGGKNLSTVIRASGGGKTKDFSVTYRSTGYDYYYARCMDKENGKLSYCSSGHASNVASTVRGDNNCNNRNPGSDCAYFDVEFTGEISLKEIYDYFGNSNKISFEIITTTGSETLKSPFGVSSNNCKVNGSVGKCGDGIDISLGNGKLKINGVTDQVKATITQGLARYTNFTTLGSGVYYSNSVFTTKGYHKGGHFSKNSGLVSFNSNYYIINGSFNGSGVIPGNSNNFVIFDSWVQAANQLQLTFNDVGEIEIPRFTCLSGYRTDKYSNMSVTCGNSSELKSCDKSSGVPDSFNATYKLSASELERANRYKKCANQYETDSNSLGIDLEILIHQHGVFTFDTPDPSTVYAGRGFKFPILNYKNTFFAIFNYDINSITKDFEVNWKVSNYYPPEYGTRINELTGIEETYLIKEEETKCDGEASYKFKLTREEASLSIEGYSSVEKFLYAKAGTVFDNSVNKANVNEYKVTSPESYSSNGEYNPSFVEVAGKWNSNVGGLASGKKVYNFTGTNMKPGNVSNFSDSSVSPKYVIEFTKYDIADPYIRVIGDEMSNIYYGDGYDSNKDKDLKDDYYYVPLMYPESEKFPIIFNTGYLSFINDIEWLLDATCNISVRNVPYDCTTNSCNPNFRYRPINLSEPFPDGNVPTNWSSWWNDSSGDYRNRKRINETYNNGIFYSIDLKHGNISSGGYLATNDSKIDYADYNNWNSLNKNGVSSFVNSTIDGYKFNKYKSNSFCKIGEFGASCDEYK